MGKGFLTGGYKGPNSGAICPGGKGFGSPSTGGLNKKISAKQVPSKNIGLTAGKSGAKLIPAKSEQKRDQDISAKGLQTLQVHYK